MDKKILVLTVALLLAVTVVAGCTGNGVPDEDTGVPGNGEEEEREDDVTTEVSSIDAEWIGYEGGEFEGGVRVRARNMDTEDYDWRVESADPDEHHIVIWNSDENAVYITQPGEEDWTKAIGTLAEQFGKEAFKGMVTTSESWAKNFGEGMHDVHHGDESLEIEVDLNPTLGDDLFVPPEDAEVEEPAMGI